MAIDGTYNVTVSTPIGKKDGTITFKTEGNVLTGTSIGGGETVSVEEGTINGNELQFKMDMTTPMGKIKLKASATVEGNKISGIFKMPLGTMKWEGIKA